MLASLFAVCCETPCPWCPCHYMTPEQLLVTAVSLGAGVVLSIGFVLGRVTCGGKKCC